MSKVKRSASELEEFEPGIDRWEVVEMLLIGFAFYMESLSVRTNN